MTDDEVYEHCIEFLLRNFDMLGEEIEDDVARSTNAKATTNNVARAALVTKLAALIKRVRRIFFQYTLLDLGRGGHDPIPPSSYNEDALVKLCELIKYDLNTLERMMHALTASYPDDRGKRIDAVHAPVTGAFGAELLRLYHNHEFAPAALLTGFMNLSGVYGQALLQKVRPDPDLTPETIIITELGRPHVVFLKCTEDNDT